VFFEVFDFIHLIFFVILECWVDGEEDCFEFSAGEKDGGGGVQDGKLLCVGRVVEVEADVGDGEDFDAK